VMYARHGNRKRRKEEDEGPRLSPFKGAHVEVRIVRTLFPLTETSAFRSH